MAVSTHASRSVSAWRAGLAVAVALWGRTLALVWVAAPRTAAAMGALLVLQAAMPIGALWASRGVIDAAAGTFGLAGPTTGGGVPLSVWIGVAVALIVAQQLLAPLVQAAQEAAGDAVTAHVNGELLRAVGRWRGLARFEDPAFADHLAVARKQAARGPVDLVSYGGQLLLAAGTVAVTAAVLGQLHPLAPLLLILAAVPQALLEHDFGQQMSNEYRTTSPDGRRLDTYFDAVLAAPPAKDVRLFDLGGFFVGRYGIVFGRLMGDLWRLRRRLLWRMVPAQALAGSVAAGVSLYAVRRALDGTLGLGDLVLYGGALLQLEGALTVAGFHAGFVATYLGWLPSLFTVLDAPPDLPVPPPERARSVPRPLRHGLVLEGVSFRYPGATSWALRDLSLHLRPGERLALVGRNGAGKTTLVKLLARLYDPTEGRVLLDGADLRDYDLDDLRRQIGVVFQDFVRYDLTAGENVGLGDPAHLHDVDRVRVAAERGGAAPLLAALPRGAGTVLGARFGGVEVSGGQWQTLALSRAFMRDAQLLILDEPTATLDVRAEHDVYRRFADLTRGTATVLVSHRFSTVRMADRIAYLEDGRVTEQGTHAALLAQGGGYARLYALQAERYQ